MRNPRAVANLEKVLHPYTGIRLTSAPRRLTEEDVGYNAKELDTWSDASVTGTERPLPPACPRFHVVT